MVKLVRRRVIDGIGGRAGPVHQIPGDEEMGDIDGADVKYRQNKTK